MGDSGAAIRSGGLLWAEKMIEPLPFEQQPSESHQAFAAFCNYRDLGKDRSIDCAYEVANGQLTGSKRAPRRWMEWSRQHNWVERARSYDAALDARARAGTEQEAIERRRRMLEGHAQTAKRLQDAADLILTEFNERLKVRGGMKGIDGRTLVQLLLGTPKMLDTGQKLERLAEGEYTDKHEHTITIAQAEQMSDDELDAALKELNLL